MKRKAAAPTDERADGGGGRKKARKGAAAVGTWGSPLRGAPAPRSEVRCEGKCTDKGTTTRRRDYHRSCVPSFRNPRATSPSLLLRPRLTLQPGVASGYKLTTTARPDPSPLLQF